MAKSRQTALQYRQIPKLISQVATTHTKVVIKMAVLTLEMQR